MSPNQFNQYIDHTFLSFSADETFQKESLNKLCQEANKYRPFSVCIREHHISSAKEQLNNNIAICAVASFPISSEIPLTKKLNEISRILDLGVSEVDTVMDFSLFKNRNKNEFINQIFEISSLVQDKCLKIILETCILTPPEIQMASEWITQGFIKSGHTNKRFLKTSTGFAKDPKPGRPIGVTIQDIDILLKESKGQFGIKPSGGISDINSARKFYEILKNSNLYDNELTPYQFRIGSSSLLLALNSDIAHLNNSY